MAIHTKEELVRHIDKLPNFSMTVAKIMQLSNNPQSSAKDLIHAISLDPAMTGKVLGLINSAYFGMREKVVSLNRAVIMLGINTIKNVAIGSAVVSSLKMQNNFRWFTGEQFWEHSLGVAVGAKTIATYIGVPFQNRDEFFIAGLLHDIGKVVLVQHMTDDFARLTAPDYRSGAYKSVVEKEEYGIDHAELGGFIARKWELPEVLVEGIQRHHHPVFAGTVVDQVVAAVHVADYYCLKKEIGIPMRVEMESFDSAALKTLAIEASELDSVFGDIEKMVEEAKVFLKN